MNAMENANMPIRKVKGGYKWGGQGHTYPNRKGAERQAAAAHANGYKGMYKSLTDRIDIFIKQESPEQENRRVALDAANTFRRRHVDKATAPDSIDAMKRYIESLKKPKEKEIRKSLIGRINKFVLKNRKKLDTKPKLPYNEGPMSNM